MTPEEVVKILTDEAERRSRMGDIVQWQTLMGAAELFGYDPDHPKPIGEAQPGAPPGYKYGDAYQDVVQICRDASFEEAVAFVKDRFRLEYLRGAMEAPAPVMKKLPDSQVWLDAIAVVVNPEWSARGGFPRAYSPADVLTRVRDLVDRLEDIKQDGMDRDLRT